jgi:hypothetical protein
MAEITERHRKLTLYIENDSIVLVDTRKGAPKKCLVFSSDDGSVQETGRPNTAAYGFGRHDGSFGDADDFEPSKEALDSAQFVHACLGVLPLLSGSVCSLTKQIDAAWLKTPCVFSRKTLGACYSFGGSRSGP